MLGVLLFAQCTKPQAANEEATRKMYAAFNAHNWKAMADCYAENAMFLDPSFGKEYVVQTHAQIEAKYAELNGMFPDIHDEVVEMYSIDDKVIIQFVATGQSGDSIKLKLPICGVLTFKDGKIVRDATYYDN